MFDLDKCYRSKVDALNENKTSYVELKDWVIDSKNIIADDIYDDLLHFIKKKDKKGLQGLLDDIEGEISRITHAIKKRNIKRIRTGIKTL